MKSPFAKPSTVARTKTCAALLFTICGLLTQARASDVEDVTVEVVGVGMGAYESRMDAVRQALQQVLPQIVFADREIKNDELVRDQVMSSMQGHAKSVVTIEQKVVDGRVQGRYNVTISTREIENFIRYRRSSGSSSQIDGEALGAELQREQESRVFRDNYVRRLVQGFPSQMVQSKVTGLKPTSDLSEVEVSVVWRLNPNWVRTMHQSLEQISCTTKLNRDRGWRIEPSANCDTPVCFTPRVGFSGYPRPGVTGYSQCIFPGTGTEGSKRNPTGNPSMNLLNGGTFFFLSRFVSADGQPLGNGFCMEASWPVPVSQMYIAEGDTDKAVVFSPDEQMWTYRLNLRAIGLDRVDAIQRLHLTPIVQRHAALWTDVTAQNPAVKGECRIRVRGWAK